MKYLAINKKPYALDYALFDKETKSLLDWGAIFFTEKEIDERVVEKWEKINELIGDIKPNVVLTQTIDLRRTLKRDLEHIIETKTIIRKLCYDKSMIYAEFKTSGWEKRITKLKNPSPTAKLKIAHEYDKTIERVEIAEAIILGEGVVWGRLQIGRD